MTSTPTIPIPTPPTNPFIPTKELLSHIFDIVKLAIPADSVDKAQGLFDRALGSIDEASEAFNQQQQQIKMLLEKSPSEVSQAQLKEIGELKTTVDQFSNRLNKTKRDGHNSQIACTKDNILVRTTRDAKAVNEHIKTLVMRGSSGSVKPPDFAIHLISSSADATRTTNPNKFQRVIGRDGGRAAPTSLLFKVYMGPYYKDLLFKGLASKEPSRETRANSNSEKSDFNISHDTPLFLRKNRIVLEQCAYSLRKSLKERYDIRTKVVLKDQNLRLFYNCKEDRNWVSAVSSTATGELHQSVQDTMYLAAKEGDHYGAFTVPDVISKLTTY